MAVIDHLVIGAATLDQGTAWLGDRIGVAPAGGGAHARMGTHNRVLRLGPRLYLEVIAIDPAAPPPGRPRWFDLDDPALRARLAEHPHPIAWVVRTPNIVATAARSPVPPGPVEPMSRGGLSWRITIPADGIRPAGGVLPALIEWPAGVHPADAMAESGCTLRGLALAHPDPDRIEACLSAVGFDAGAVAVTAGDGEPGIVLLLDTPRGEVVLA